MEFRVCVPVLSAAGALSGKSVFLCVRKNPRKCPRVQVSDAEEVKKRLFVLELPDHSALQAKVFGEPDCIALIDGRCVK